MRAVEVPSFGPPEVLTSVDRPRPEPGAGDVSIAVSHAGVNFADVMTRRGDYHGNVAPPVVLGLEVAGTVLAVGTDVTMVRAGQRVAAFTGTGGYAEVAVADEALTFAVPDEMNAATAAGATVVATTAGFLVDDVARVRPGEAVLVHAAAGGVGTLLGQLARLRGASPVLGTVGSADKVAYVRGFGFHDVLLRDGFPDAVRARTDGHGADVVFDSLGGDTRTLSLAALRPLARLVVFGNASGEPERGPDSGDLRTTNRSVLGFSLGSLRRTDPARVRPVAERRLADVADGVLRVDVARVLPLDQAVEAHRLLESRRSRGKLVLRVRGAR